MWKLNIFTRIYIVPLSTVEILKDNIDQGPRTEHQ